MREKKTLAIVALLALALTGAAAAQNQIIVIPLGSASEGPRNVTAEAVPAGPTSLQAVAVSSGQVNLTWVDNASDETQYRLEIRTPSTSFADVGTTIPANTTAVQVFGLQPSTTYIFRVRARNAEGNSSYSNEATATTSPATSTCVPSATAMCLNDNRFRVEAAFQTSAGQSGQAHAVKLTDDSGYLWFFSSTNIELIVKVLDACIVNDRFWVFAGGLTNVQVLLIVTDTETGIQKRYTNPQGTAYLPLQDTNAFGTCP